MSLGKLVLLEPFVHSRTLQQPPIMKLYAVCDGPPSLACRMTLKHLNISFELVEVNFNVGEHLTEEYAKVICELAQAGRRSGTV